MALEGLYVPTSAPWYAEFKSELLSFPAGKHDQVDALGLIGQLLDQMVPGQRPEQPQKPKPDTGYRLCDWPLPANFCVGLFQMTGPAQLAPSKRMGLGLPSGMVGAGITNGKLPARLPLQSGRYRAEDE